MNRGTYIERSLRGLQSLFTQGFRRGSSPQLREDLVMCDFKRGRDLDQLAMGCDRDIWDSSTSTVLMDYSEAEDAARFHGHIAAGGYAAWRTQRPLAHMFGVPSFNLSQLSHLQLRLKGTRQRKYFVNIQADSDVPTDIYQHRIFLKDLGNWESVSIPLADFVQTSHGQIIREQAPMRRDKIRTVGISILDRQPGPYELFVQSVVATNKVKE